MKTTIRVDEYLAALRDENGVCDPARFTIIDHSERDELEIAEIVAATGVKNVIDIINFTPNRIAFQNTIASVVSNIQIGDERDFHPLVKQIYNNKVIPKLNIFIEKQLPLITNYVDKEVGAAIATLDRPPYKEPFSSLNPIATKVEEIKTLVDKRIASGKYKLGEFNLGETRKTIIEKIAKDAIKKEILENIIEVTVNEVVQDIIKEKAAFKLPESQKKEGEENIIVVRPISMHSGSERHTFMLAGAPACGKGTAESLMIEQAGNLGVTWNDVIKLNTDNYRSLLSENSRLGTEVWKHAQLNHDEARLVTYKIIKTQRDRVQTGQAPHILFDGVAPSQEKIDLGTADGGRVHIKMVSLEPEISIKRADERGKRTGRFVPTSFILESHKEAPGNLQNIIAGNIGQDIEFELYDTDVPLGARPKLVKSGNLKTGEIIVHDLSSACTFHGRKYLNANAQEIRNIWPEGEKALSNEFLETYLSNHGLQVEVQYQGKSVLRLQEGIVYGSEKQELKQALHDEVFIKAVNKESRHAEAQIENILKLSEQAFEIESLRNHNITENYNEPIIPLILQHKLHSQVPPLVNGYSSMPSGNALTLLGAVISPIAMLAGSSAQVMGNATTSLTSAVSYDPLAYGIVLGASALIAGISGYFLYNKAAEIDEKWKLKHNEEKDTFKIKLVNEKKENKMLNNSINK
ncbi:zeta toxin family protein [Candidatus Jidaibacter acanthamoebae]|nr:zeta toxin family protein [Candidatus Jidaibacter acanthamoeba]